MTARAYVNNDFPRDQVVIYLGERCDDGRVSVGEPTDIVFRTMEPMEAAAERGPTLRLSESMARALLDALVAHFGGTAEVQTLRKDYLHERARVDKMIEHLISGGVR